MRMMYYSPVTRTASSTPSAGAIAVPGSVYQDFMEDQRNGVPLELGADGVTPLPFYRLLSLSGLQGAVAAEFKVERAALLSALTTLGYMSLRSNNTVMLAEVDAAIAFLQGVLTMTDVLAVQPGTGPGQGAQVLKDLIYSKWIGYRNSRPSAVKAAFAAVS